MKTSTAQIMEHFNVGGEFVFPITGGVTGIRLKNYDMWEEHTLL